MQDKISSTKRLFETINMARKEIDNMISETKELMKEDTDLAKRIISSEIIPEGTYLHIATLLNLEPLCQLLLENSSSPPEYCDKFLNTPLDYCIFNKTGFTPLTYDRLIARGAQFSSPLYYASFEGDLLKIEDLTSNNLEMLLNTDSAGNTAIFYAVVNNRKEVVDYIIEKNSKFNVKNKDGMTILHFIAINNHLELLNFLTSDPKFQKTSPLNINEQDNEGYTALHYAVLNEHDDMIAALIAKGADTTLKNIENESAFDLAKTSTNKIKALFKIAPDSQERIIKSKQYETYKPLKEEEDSDGEDIDYQRHGLKNRDSFWRVADTNNKNISPSYAVRKALNDVSDMSKVKSLLVENDLENLKHADPEIKSMELNRLLNEALDRGDEETIQQILVIMSSKNEGKKNIDSLNNSSSLPSPSKTIADEQKEFGFDTRTKSLFWNSSQQSNSMQVTKNPSPKTTTGAEENSFKRKTLSLEKENTPITIIEGKTEKSTLTP